MIHDWHATYLTDPTVHASARERCARTGEDGWAAAATLAPTLPPGFGSHESAGARAVLVPCTEPNEVEEADLRDVSQFESDAEVFRDPSSPEEWEARRDLTCLVPPNGRSSLLAELAHAAQVIADREAVIGQRLGEVLGMPRDLRIMIVFDEATAPRSPSREAAPILTAADLQRQIAAAMGIPPGIVGIPPTSEPDTLRHLLEQARDGAITLEDADDHPAIGEARRRRLVTEPSPALSGRGAQRRARSNGGTALLHLTELGKVELRRMKSADR